MGYIYILTNPSFKEWVKIGYADDINRRVDELNRSTSTPFAFRVYATYEVEDRLKDISLHAIIDKLNPNLRSREVIKGKVRIREFFLMTKEDAYDLFYAIAEISGTTNRLKKVVETEKDIVEEKEAEEIEEVVKRRQNFNFLDLGIPVGSVLEFCKDPNIACVVKSGRRIEYEGIEMSISSLATELAEQFGYHGPKNGAEWFTYNGKLICDIREEIENK